MLCNHCGAPNEGKPHNHKKVHKTKNITNISITNNHYPSPSSYSQGTNEDSKSKTSGNSIGKNFSIFLGIEVVATYLIWTSTNIDKGNIITVALGVMVFLFILAVCLSVLND